jgi:predicted esterase
VRRAAYLLVVALVVVVAAGCLPKDPGPTALYRGVQSNITPVVTPKAQPITWGAAPPIDANYGGTLYAGTGIQTQDPRPALVDGLEPLRLWVANPNNGVTQRPAILWFHGGGFAVGLDSMYGLANGTGKDYAKRGYVSFSVEYRIDSTLVGTGTRPPSLCQWVQDHVNPEDAVWVQRFEQCRRNVLAAQYDALAAVRWVRAHAAEYGVDPNKIAIGGFSAGAVISELVAFQSDQVGTLTYSTGDTLSPADSKVQAAIGASGCLPTPDFGAPTTIDANDAPTSFIASKFDQALPYDCAKATTSTARSIPLVAELTSYCTESYHANVLYDQHKAATDDQWTTFLVRQLKIYSGTREPTAAPFCT